MSNLRKDLIEIIWYEMGDGLNATDVQECALTIEYHVRKETERAVKSLLERLYSLDDGTVSGMRKVSEAINDELRILRADERS